jgi:hypothetical protein
MSGADLANLVNEGALLAARRNHDKVYMVDLEDAKDKVMLGAERKSMVMSEQERSSLLSRRRPRCLHHQDEGQRSAAQGHDRSSRSRDGSRLHPA